MQGRHDAPDTQLPIGPGTVGLEVRPHADDRRPAVGRSSRSCWGLGALRDSSRPRAVARGAAGGRDEHGFTLIELLVVVLVLGALIAIAVPTFTGQRQQAWDAAVKAELRSAMIALESYRAQNGQYALAALTAGSDWGYQPSGDLVDRLEFPWVINAQTYCLIGQYASALPENPNNRFIARQDGLIVEGTPLSDCSI
jgi:prepilin-type N-terminal cleavage/methylation domain-containing protein